MNKKQYAATLRYKRIVGLCRQFPLPGPRGPRLVAELERCTTAIDRLVHPQNMGPNQRTNHAATGQQLRAKLRRGHMLPLSRQVKLLFRDDPRLVAAMAVPHVTASNTTLLAAARRMATALKVNRYRTFLLREGVAPALLAGLTTAADALKAWHESTAAAVKASTRATAEIKTLIAEAGRLQLAIEGIVIEMSITDPRIWTLWLHERRRRKKMGRPRKAAH